MTWATPSLTPWTSCGQAHRAATSWCFCRVSVKSETPPNTCAATWRITLTPAMWRCCRSLLDSRKLSKSRCLRRAAHRASCWLPMWPKPRSPCQAFAMWLMQGWRGSSATASEAKWNSYWWSPSAKRRPTNAQDVAVVWPMAFAYACTTKKTSTGGLNSPSQKFCAAPWRVSFCA